MAIIYSYPTATPESGDKLVGTDITGKVTKNFTVGSIVSTEIPTYITGTTNTVPIFTSSNAIGDSIITADTNGATIGGNLTVSGTTTLSAATATTTVSSSNDTSIATTAYVKSNIGAITKSDIGLGNVDNTSDLNKPTSNATNVRINFEEGERQTQDGLLQSQINSLTSGVIGGLSIADVPTVDGTYIAEESGVYTNAGNLNVTLIDKIAYILISSNQTVFQLVEVPITNTDRKNYDSIAALIASGDNLTQGDLLYIRDTETTHLVKERLRYAIKFQEISGAAPKYECSTLTSGLSLVAGDKISMECFFNNSFSTIANSTYIFALNNPISRILAQNNDYRFTGFGTNANGNTNFGNFKAYDEFGIEIETDKIPAGQWVKLEWEMLQNYTATKITLNYQMRGVGSNYKVAKLTVKNEVFDMSTISSGESVTSNLGSVLSNVNSATAPTVWEKDNYTGYSNNNIDDFYVKLLIDNNNVITPQDLGFIQSDLENDNTNDAYPYIQACLDSDYEVNIPPGNYYISKELKLTKAKRVTMAGSFVLDETGDNYIPSKGAQKSITRIWTDQNIHMFTIATAGAYVSGGKLDTIQIPLHTRAAYRINYAAKMWGCVLKDIWVAGNQSAMSVNAGIGTIGIYFDMISNVINNVSRTSYDSVSKKATLTFPSGTDLTAYGLEVGAVFHLFETGFESRVDTLQVLSIDNVTKQMEVFAQNQLSQASGATTGLIFSEANPQGYLYELKSNGFIQDCAKGVSLPAHGLFRCSTSNNDFNFSLKACKEFYSFLGVMSKCEIKGMLQDGPVLPEAEKSLYAATILTANNILDLHMVDRQNHVTTAPYSHGESQYFIAPQNHMQPMMLTVQPELDSVIQSDNSIGHWVVDPEKLILSNNGTNFISSVDNSKATTAFETGYSLKKYEAPNLQWFSDNLIPADDASAATPLTPLTDNTKVQINDISLFKGFTSDSDYIRINAASQYGFAEFVLPCDNETISTYGFNTPNAVPLYFQVIMFNVSGTVVYSQLNNITSETGLKYFDANGIAGVSKILVRIIGNRTFATNVDALIRIEDIFFQSKGSVVSPFLRRGAAAEQQLNSIINKNGSSFIDYNSPVNPNSFLSISANHQLDLFQKTDTIYINNTSGVTRAVGLNSNNMARSISGREFTIVATTASFYDMTDSSPINIQSNVRQLLAHDSTYTMGPGDYITFKVVGLTPASDASQASNVCFVETKRGSLIAPSQAPKVWTANATSVSVFSQNLDIPTKLQTANTVATSFVTATQAELGQELYLIVKDALTTIIHNSGSGSNKFILKGGADVVAPINTAYKFLYVGTYWVEV